MRIPDPAPRHAREAAPDAQAFLLEDGSRARSLVELVEHLATASGSLAWHHREHFVPWLRDVVGDAPLARRFEFYARQGEDPEALRDTLVALGRTRLRELDSLRLNGGA